MAEAGQTPRANKIVFVLLCLYLGSQAAWRVVVRAGQWPSTGVRNMEIGIDALMAVGIIGLYVQLGQSNDGRPPFATPLLILALVAIAIIFGIRFSSDVGWWTGHRLNWRY